MNDTSFALLVAAGIFAGAALIVFLGVVWNMIDKEIDKSEESRARCLAELLKRNADK